MKCKVDYRGNTYGNRDEATTYDIVLTRNPSERNIESRFAFAEPQWALGVHTSGKVKGCTISIPRTVATALAHAIHLAQSETETAETRFQIKETLS